MKILICIVSILLLSASEVNANIPKYCKPYACCVDKCPCVKKCLCECSCSRKKKK